MPRRTGLAGTMAWGWTALILVACWLPSRHVPEDDLGGLEFRIPHLDKVIHATLFAGFGYLWLMAGRPGWIRAAGLWAAGVALAVATELGQGLEVVGRDPTLGDGLADVVGLTLALGGTLIFVQGRQCVRGRSARASDEAGGPRAVARPTGGG